MCLFQTKKNCINHLFCTELYSESFSLAMMEDVSSGDILLEYLEVAVHTVLHARQLYPEAIYMKKKAYGTFVYCSIHPGVNEYITESLKGVQKLIQKNEVKKVCVVFFDEHKCPTDKVVFDILALYAALSVDDSYFIHTEESLRSSLFQIRNKCRMLRPLSDNHSFSIQIHTSEMASLTLTDDPNKQECYPWIEEEQKSVKIVCSVIVPMREIITDYMHLDIYAVECCLKADKEK